MKGDPFIAARVSPETKSRFAALAIQQHVSESALLKRLVDVALLGCAPPHPTLATQAHICARGARISVRLQADDHRILAERAAGRHMPSATYVSALVRAHLTSQVPLPQEETCALKASVAALVALGRLLNPIARAAHQGGPVKVPGLDHLAAMLRICEALRVHVHGLIKTNQASWVSGFSHEPS
ncbi:MAG TPA: hypothetical protein VK505_01225 [Steroidobacteraceae bacterium]|nr:hypothetical protein [Steroidobacteraceae bacterium]